ncbi:pilus assembly protein PilZ [Pseudomonas gingeri NCPPB 3146 = LMG 5327]|uniref:PilZ domain-containing protein n=2 Tax=Pseudomonas gingeri TaxID=117681 RepID=A0A7Y8CDI5_9PSED|nr:MULTISPECIES: PilZ domain-containing protein [Pseudomonas]NVZ29104.1 PilZ domain-containing protein [Pseudomonas gingeri]NWA07094.1 PilZ domain-containing protein [Pseudomonas gingeri]NWC14112.1 PilZ domain-containing protein [Pseudomonas gingeri]NWE47808.1 PilZ domain-containing protein [Pseudomonas gingeri]NWE70298.1 PilZ domain-containing protein [Pseudomonas gingeri]
MSDNKNYLRIKIQHPSIGECLGQTRNLSSKGVYVQHPGLSRLPTGTVVYGQVQDLPVAAPRIRMEVIRVDAEGIGLRFIDL